MQTSRTQDKHRYCKNVDLQIVTPGICKTANQLTVKWHNLTWSLSPTDRHPLTGLVEVINGVRQSVAYSMMPNNSNARVDMETDGARK